MRAQNGNAPLPKAHARLKRIAILNSDALDVIRSQDGHETLFYLDPPYLPETRVTTSDYEFEMSLEQHEKLLTVLAGIKGRFLLSGYASKLYEDAATANGWTCHNKASGKKVKDKKVECLWANFSQAA
jgi:DNA adenine methylase